MCGSGFILRLAEVGAVVFGGWEVEGAAVVGNDNAVDIARHWTAYEAVAYVP